MSVTYPESDEFLGDPSRLKARLKAAERELAQARKAMLSSDRDVIPAEEVQNWIERISAALRGGEQGPHE